MNILITGAGGFIGSHLSNVLEKENKVFRVFYPSNYIEGQSTFSVNLTDVSTVKKLTKDLSKQVKIDVLIHLASKMALLNNIEDVGLLKENIIITENITTIVKAIKARIFINFSSMAIYPNITGSFSENSLPEPQKNSDCLYGLSKFCSEVMIDFLLRNTNIRILHLRISQVIGKGMYDDRIIPVMLNELKNNNTITVFGDGERKSNFIELNILSDKIEYFLNNEVSGIYNVGNMNISYYELAKI